MTPTELQNLLEATLEAAAIVAPIVAVVALLVWRYVRAARANEVFGVPISGTIAEVTVAVPERGVGQIAFTVNGSRVTLPARTDSRRGLARGTRAVIVDVAGHVACVHELDL